jgi:nucleotidyltransferase substrate binding protein (TIGR01987 family)
LWKTLQEYARFKGLEVASPRDAFRVSADLGIVENPNVWFDFIKDRNLTTHIYSESEAEKIFSHIPSFVRETEKVIFKIETEDK